MEESGSCVDLSAHYDSDEDSDGEPVEKKELEIFVKDGKLAVKKICEFSKNEQKILMTIDHPRIPKFLERLGPREIAIEYIDGIDLFDYMRNRFFDKLDEVSAAKIIDQLSEIVEYLHNLKIAHLDIKLENIIVKTRPLDREAIPELYLIDFDLSLDTKTETTTRFSGSSIYAAPEILLHKQNYDPFAADIYSLGVLWYGLLLGVYPYNIKDRVKYLGVWRKNPPLNFKDIPEGSVTAIERMTENIPTLRGTIEDVRKDVKRILASEIADKSSR